jgi:hypothetical protein
VGRRGCLVGRLSGRRRGRGGGLAGAVAPWIGITPRAESRQAMVLAVPITPQVPPCQALYGKYGEVWCVRNGVMNQGLVQLGPARR